MLTSHLGSAESRFGNIGFAIPEAHVPLVPPLGAVIRIAAHYTPTVPQGMR